MQAAYDRQASPGADVIPMRRRLVGEGFTDADLHLLRRWCGDDWYAAIWDTEMGAVAMLYPRGLSWASYALAREHGRIFLWNSVTLADIGRFPTMADALRAIPAPGSSIPVTTATIIPFRRRPLCA